MDSRNVLTSSTLIRKVQDVKQKDDSSLIFVGSSHGGWWALDRKIIKINRPLYNRESHYPESPQFWTTQNFQQMKMTTIK